MVAWTLMLPKPPTKRLSFWAPDAGEGNDFQIGRPTHYPDCLLLGVRDGLWGVRRDRAGQSGANGSNEGEWNQAFAHAATKVWAECHLLCTADSTRALQLSQTQRRPVGMSFGSSEMQSRAFDHVYIKSGTCVAASLSLCFGSVQTVSKAAFRGKRCSARNKVKSDFWLVIDVARGYYKCRTPYLKLTTSTRLPHYPHPGASHPSALRQSQPVYPGLSPCGFRQTYSSNLTSASSYSRFPHSLMLSPSGMHPTGIPHPAIVPPSGKQEHDQYDRGMYVKPQMELKREKEPKKPVIKKPLNAFMLYMKEMRAKGKKKRRKREKQQDSNTGRAALKPATVSTSTSAPPPQAARRRPPPRQHASPRLRQRTHASHARLPREQSIGKRSDLRQPTIKHTHTHLELSGKHCSTTALSAAKAAGLSLKVLTETQ
ncbi:Lymphoid enhancer-binding factor 1 [Channa argus]|uniref:Lymphoid enhancer-binding factor 1 n=1 Tax=Channa argus TaxID=215402 RepID=A0A6G1QSW2_CHAAH|nr:Lymphoid enhancer-binding factor 1 [Channa argus]